MHLGSYYLLITGLSLLLTVLFNPIGVAGKTREDYEKMRARFWPRKTPAKVAVESNVPVGVPESAGPRQIGDVALTTRGVTVRYGGIVAVSGVDIEVRAGEIVGLIGPNGAGKTSFVDALTGFTRSAGEVTLAGHRLDGRPAHERARRGLVRTWQAGELFDDLSVADNVRVAQGDRE